MRVPAADLRRRDTRAVCRAQHLAGRARQGGKRVAVAGRLLAVVSQDRTGEAAFAQTLGDRGTGDLVGLIQRGDLRVEVGRGAK